MLGSLLLEYARCVQVYNYLPASVNIVNELEGFCMVSFDWLVAFSGMGCKIGLVLLPIPCLGSCGTVSAGPIREGSWVQNPPEVSLCLLGQLNPSFTRSSTKQNKTKNWYQFQTGRREHTLVLRACCSLAGFLCSRW